MQSMYAIHSIPTPSLNRITPHLLLMVPECRKGPLSLRFHRLHAVFGVSSKPIAKLEFPLGSIEKRVPDFEFAFLNQLALNDGSAAERTGRTREPYTATLLLQGATADRRKFASVLATLPSYDLVT
jgi:hypothetical protein